MFVSCSQRPVLLLLLQDTFILLFVSLLKTHPSWNQAFLLPLNMYKHSSNLYGPRHVLPLPLPSPVIPVSFYGTLWPGLWLSLSLYATLQLQAVQPDFLSSPPRVKGVACFCVTCISSGSNTYYLALPEHSRVRVFITLPLKQAQCSYMDMQEDLS